ncbi:hypothetical protein FHT44_006185 [Mycolicibacterium sp. BK634]|uniref:hypothetical protein n=1 Tax=Mycolicibacterium sp. BK634 TaxID=2587099 RepID=UPI00161AF3B4|nr:hypothetical protein [Mycolicibacterium sp. BK634]MBB3753663.1 hypothetical protein [Mycolicibacterium sp. BK634]
MARRGDNKTAKQRRQEREKQRRQASANREPGPGPEEFGIKMPPKVPPGMRPPRPDFSGIDWDKLEATYPEGAHELMRAMLRGLIGERAKQAKDFLAWGLRPHPIRSESRLAKDNDAVTLDDEPNLVSSTALYPIMNACEHLAAAAEVIALGMTQRQLRTSATAALCRIAMESAAKTIWLISETDTEERIRRCYGFLKGERGRQEEFERLEAEALQARTDPLAEADLATFETRRARVIARQTKIAALPAEALIGPSGGPLKLVEDAEVWMDRYLPWRPDPELDNVMHPRSAKTFYSLGSGFVHGFKWLMGYVLDEEKLDDTPLLVITLDAFRNAIRMTEGAVSLYEAQAVGPLPDPRRVRNYPAGLADAAAELAPIYR